MPVLYISPFIEESKFCAKKRKSFGVDVTNANSFYGVAVEKQILRIKNAILRL